MVPSNPHQSRAARYVLPITTAQTANTTPVLRDVRRAIKIFSYTVHGAFFFIFEKEWGVQSRTGNRCKTGGRVIPAPTGALTAGGWGHPPLRGAVDDGVCKWDGRRAEVVPPHEGIGRTS